MDEGQIHALRKGQSLRVQIRATDDHQFFRLARGLDGLVQGMDHGRAFGLVVPVPADDDMGPARQQPGKGFPGSASHDHGFAHGHRLEMLQICRQMPGQPVVVTDDAVAGHGADDADKGLVHGSHYDRAKRNPPVAGFQRSFI